MKILKFTNRRHPLIPTVMLGLMLFLGNSYGLQAQSSPATEGYVGIKFLPPFQNLSNQLNPLCEPEMQDFSEKLLADYRSFVETNFQNKSSTASLIETAIGKYRELSHNLYTAYYKYYPNEGSFVVTTGTEPKGCLKIVQDTLSAAKTLLKTHAIHTSGVKKTTALLEKYRSINNQLGMLYQQFLYLKANLDGFADKLPCYISKSCVK